MSDASLDEKKQEGLQLDEANRVVTLRDIAESAGVSIGTVSLVLNDRKGVAATTRQKVMETARLLGYEQSPRRTPTAHPAISIIIERLPVAPTSDPFNKAILLGVDAVARRAGYRVGLEFVSPADTPDISHWEGGALAGLLILGGGDLSRDWVQAAIESSLPVVVVDHFIPAMELPAVVPDNFAGAYAATQHLLDMGHTRIGFIRGPSKYWTLGERQAGYMLAMQRAGLGPDPELVPPRVSHGGEKGYGEMQILLDLPEPPTAVFAVSDKAAIGAYRAVLGRGLSVPGNISIVGFDDIEEAQVLNPPLTTVHISGETLGRVAAERLLNLIEVPDQDPSISSLKWTVPTTLKQRGSVRNIRDV